ncbi:MAG: plasmid mobilization protein [Lachnospiraceae bacterium]
MYKRENLTKTKLKSKRNEKNRYRNVIMNFRVTQEEKERIEQRIFLSGLKRQDYFIQSLMNQKVVCYGNIRLFDAVKKQLVKVEKHIESLCSLNDVDENLLGSIRMILELYNGIENSEETNKK